eukprot:6252743-Prymnesium_polylepis.1
MPLSGITCHHREVAWHVTRGEGPYLGRLRDRGPLVSGITCPGHKHKHMHMCMHVHVRGGCVPC